MKIIFIELSKNNYSLVHNNIIWIKIQITYVQNKRIFFSGVGSVAVFLSFITHICYSYSYYKRIFKPFTSTHLRAYFKCVFIYKIHILVLVDNRVHLNAWFLFIYQFWRKKNNKRMRKPIVSTLLCVQSLWNIVNVNVSRLTGDVWDFKSLWLN